MIDPVFTKLVSFLLGLLLAASAWHKWAAFDRFVAIVRDYRLLPDHLARPAAGMVVVAETALALGWLSGAMASLTAMLTACMFSVYGAAIAVNLLRGRVHISCGCGLGEAANGGQLLSWTLVLRNAVLAGLALLPLFPLAPRPLHPVDWATLATSLLAAVLLYFGATQLLRNGAAIQTWKHSDD
jgi:hypothetical protein